MSQAGMNVRIQWTDKVQFVGEAGSGHSLVMDGPADQGGRNSGFRPMELLLLGMGGCTAFDVVTILKKSQQPIVDCLCELRAQRAESIPSVFTQIHVHFIIKAKPGIKENQVKRAIELSAEKYCSASIMLAKGGVQITHDYKIVEET